MQTFQDVGIKLNSSITILRQKRTQMESTAEVKKTQTKPNLFFFPRKGKRNLHWGVTYIPGKGHCLLTELWAVLLCLIFCTHLNSLVRLHQLHGTSY